MEEDRRLIDLKGQCESKCWIIGHLQLTPEECEMYNGIPVVYDDELVSMPCHLGLAFVRIGLNKDILRTPAGILL
jgi:hypothetical protein